MATWTQFDYGPLAHQIAEYWVPNTGSNRPCVIYCPGGGWSTTSQRAFYDPNVGKPFFKEQIEVNEAVSGLEVVCISMMYGMAYHDFNNDAFGSDIAWASWDLNTNYTRNDVLAYNPTGIAAWVSGNSYSIGDQVANSSGTGPVNEIFECIVAHTAGGSTEPGDGANWETNWVSLNTTNERRSYECIQDVTAPIVSSEPVKGTAWQDYWRPLPPNSVANAAEVVSGGDLRKVASVSSILNEGIRDVQTMVHFMKAHADYFGINPNKIVLMGDSAGGNTCGAAAYAQSAPFAQRYSRVNNTSRELAAGASLKTPVIDSGVAAVILEITPSDMTWFGKGASLHGRNLFGINFTANDTAAETEYGLIPDEIKSSLSPLGVLKATGRALPTFLHYFGSQLGDGGDPGTSPPWTTEAPYHHARNGYYIQQELLRLGVDAADCPFYDDSNGAGTVLGGANIGATMWSWFRTQVGI